ncbi:MAG: 2-amino-4-hydroxy-6-hydroxymethyldihydropteridine diphosphokinase [Chloroflexota bacterium]
MKHTIYLGLGTNIGDRKENLSAVIKLFPPDILVSQKSEIYETAPWGYTQQAHFLNMVVKAETDLSPIELLGVVKSIETELGRTASFRYGPRVIDIDILFYNTLIHQEAKLTIPHPHVHERAFMLVPLNDISPDFVHPILKKCLSDILDTINPDGINKYNEE